MPVTNHALYLSPCRPLIREPWLAGRWREGARRQVDADAARDPPRAHVDVRPVRVRPPPSRSPAYVKPSLVDIRFPVLSP